MKLSLESDAPEFSNFFWFSMMFGAGIGIGMLTFAIADSLYHFAKNPNVILGQAGEFSADNVNNAHLWSLLRWGFKAWACCAIVGLSFAFFSYRRNLPLTPLFGDKLLGMRAKNGVQAVHAAQ